MCTYTAMKIILNILKGKETSRTNISEELTLELINIADN